MTVDAVTYYARLAPNDTVERPRSLIRRRHTPVYPTDEALRDDGRWHPTDLVERATVGDLDDELVEIPAELAETIAARWQALAEAQRRDLAAQGRGQLGMRLAAAVPAPGNERLAGVERDLVARYLREAPLVVSAFGFGPDRYANDRPQVPLHVRTDGRWVWSEALAHYAAVYALAPEPAFLAHIRTRRYRFPAVTDEVLAHAARLTRDTPETTSDHGADA
ncbi:hypothetical protein ACFO1B_27005 [Dactylosporangium siamense]|uniref:Uncharacterized protein n=1 Tax=Dactylosporangium siamense TaxID=685454 RepID=A0A919PKV2_9ACTN|nr:hypothetical protein [Dactylosporangium siamense]GIG46665.1 hypothetical protein Dsi01nite_047060 [Dactylosporangium siamense]